MKLGLTKGDRIGVWGGNHYEWLLAYAAALQLGLITVSQLLLKTLLCQIHCALNPVSPLR